MAKKETRKRTSMKDQVKKDETGEQLDFPGVRPENMKEIDAAARLYKKYSKARLSALKIEVEQKQTILELIQKSDLKPLKKGIILYKHDGVEIEVTPTDFKVKVKVKEK